MATKEVHQPLPPKDEILSWLESESARMTYLTLYLINELRHGFPPGIFSELYPLPSKIEALSPEERGEWLLEQWPIKDLSWAVFVPKLDNQLVILDNLWNDHKDEVKNQFRNDVKIDGGGELSPLDFIAGTVATVKENGWKIFDLLYDVVPVDLAKISAKGLADQGYILLTRKGDPKGMNPLHDKLANYSLIFPD